MRKGHHHPCRPACKGEDLADLQALARRTIDISYRAFLAEEAVARFIGSGASDSRVQTHLVRRGVYCLSQDGEIVGLSILDGRTIDLLMVEPGHHRRGLGRLLLQHAEATLFTNHSVIRLESFAGNDAANSFYEACGWSQTGPLDSGGSEKVEYTTSRGG